MRMLNPLSTKIEKIPFTTVNNHWKHKKDNNVTFNSIFFLCVGWVGKEKYDIESYIIDLFFVSNDD